MIREQEYLLPFLREKLNHYGITIELEIKESEFLDVIKKLYQSHKSISWNNPFNPEDLDNYKISNHLNLENLVPLNNNWLFSL